MNRIGARPLSRPEPIEWTWPTIWTALVLPHGIAGAFLGLFIL